MQWYIEHTIWYISHQCPRSDDDVSSVSNTFNNIFLANSINIYFFNSMTHCRRHNYLNHNLRINMLDLLLTFTTLHDKKWVNLVFSHLQCFHTWITIITAQFSYQYGPYTYHIFSSQPHLFSPTSNMFATSTLTLLSTYNPISSMDCYTPKIPSHHETEDEKSEH